MFQIVICMVVTAMITALATAYAFFSIKNSAYRRIEVPINLSVSETMNIGIGIIKGNVLYFGRIPPGGSGKREIIIKNNEGVPVILNIDILGNASEFVTCSGNNSEIMPQGQITVACTANIPENASPAEFEGVAIFEISKSK